MTDDNASEAPSFSDAVIKLEITLKGPSKPAAFGAVVAAVDAVFRGPWQAGLAESGSPKSVIDHWYTRLASCLTAFITDPETKINIAQLAEITRRKQIIAYIFNASGYRNMAHLLSLLGSQEGNRITLSKERLPVFYAFAGLDDITDELMTIALEQQPELLLVLMLGWLNQRAVLSEQGEKNRGRLLLAGDRIASAEITDRNIEQVINAWMYSSYASEPGKHAIKAAFNKLLRRLMETKQILPKPVSYAVKPKPTMVVIHERFKSEHAMFRCYAPYLQSLKPRFHLIAMAEAQHVDDAADSIFDEVVKLDEGRRNISELLALIQSFEPDIIYYPSLGMSHWTVMLAQLRLAPVQIMSHGHPATSMSPEIDYAYVCELEGDLAPLHSERLMIGSEYGTFAPYSGAGMELPDLITASDREVRVAVNSKVMKLSYRLLDICEQLTKESTVPVRFSFFPGERGLFYDGLAAAIHARLPAATVEPYMTYQEFLGKMCRCDLALAAFPFGNTNSTVDTCLLGLPTVVHFGPESPAQTDSMVLRTAGFPDWLVARSDEEYFDKALALINSAELRAEVISGITREAVKARLYDVNECNRTSDPFAEMFWYAYKNHPAIQSSEQRVFHHKDVLIKSAP